MSIYILRENEPLFDLDLSPDDLLWPLTLASKLRKHDHHANHHKYGKIVKKRKLNDGFEVNVDVQQFKPEEITVKVVDKFIVVEGKHDERRDEHGFVSREFQRRYLVPEDYDINKIESSLSSDGVLSLSAPKIQVNGSGERIIPVIHTGPVRQQVLDTKSEEKPAPAAQ